MRGIGRLLIVLVTTVTVLLLAAVGAAAGSGSLGSGKAVKAVVTLVAPNLGSPKSESKGGDKAEGDNNGKHKGQCHPPKKVHKHGTPGHKNHPCGEDGDDSD
jgi:hypothetical protein